MSRNAKTAAGTSVAVSVTPQGITDDSEALTGAFNAHFKKCYTHNQITKVLGTPLVKTWYAGYKATRNIEKAEPAVWSQVGLSAEEYNAGLVGQQKRAKERAALADHLSELSIEYNRKVQAALGASYKQLQEEWRPIDDILEAGYNCLEMDEVAWIEADGITREERVYRREACITSLRARCILRNKVTLAPAGPMPTKALLGEWLTHKGIEASASSLFEGTMANLKRGLRAKLLELNNTAKGRGAQPLPAFPDGMPLCEVGTIAELDVDRMEETRRDIFRVAPQTATASSSSLSGGAL